MNGFTYIQHINYKFKNCKLAKKNIYLNLTTNIFALFKN